jgi:hypothetical protein
MFDNLIFRYGTVTGPGTSTNNALVLWDGTSGTLIKNSTVTVPTSGFLGDVVGPASTTNNAVALWDGTSGRLLKNGTLTLPTSAIVGISDTQALTNKTVRVADNTSAWSGAAFLEVKSTPATEAAGGTGGAFMSFHRSSAHAVNLGLDANNVFKISGWSLGSLVPWSVTHSGVMQVYRAVYFGMYNSVIANTAATTVDFSLGQKAHLTLQASTTISCTFPGIGNYQILMIQDGTGNRTITWGAGLAPLYVGSASAPAINLAANTITLVSIYWSSANAFIAVSKVNAA